MLPDIEREREREGMGLSSEQVRHRLYDSVHSPRDAKLDPEGLRTSLFHIACAVAAITRAKVGGLSEV